LKKKSFYLEFFKNITPFARDNDIETKVLGGFPQGVSNLETMELPNRYKPAPFVGGRLQS
jgi:hypothetical protein